MAVGGKRKIPAPATWEELDRYSSVSVCCTDKACSAARSLVGTRYLVEEAPSLPLPKCNAEHCQCTFVSHRDRRNFLMNRRSNGEQVVPASKGKPQSNRRSGSERRVLKVNF